ncbi:OsmC family protein [Natribaculum luteum]|uniref:OsmC family protein n=1 Tax=Natribaculum luteum TaxID=1586232 RepID=A0ABD5NWW0_9EURY|nr:OsmC family protein [Natribaculum luteum]
MSESELTERFQVSANAVSDTKTTVETRGFEFVVDEPAPLGGTNDGPNPVEYLLGAWAGCLNVVAHTVAEEYAFELEDVQVDLAGELNPARFLGLSDDPRAGYQEIEVTISVDTDADEATLEEWAGEVEERCPVGDNVQNATPATVDVETI